MLHQCSPRLTHRGVLWPVLLFVLFLSCCHDGCVRGTSQGLGGGGDPLGYETAGDSTTEAPFGSARVPVHRKRERFHPSAAVGFITANLTDYFLPYSVASLTAAVIQVTAPSDAVVQLSDLPGEQSTAQGYKIGLGAQGNRYVQIFKSRLGTRVVLSAQASPGIL
eukprot:RCo009164